MLPRVYYIEKILIAEDHPIQSILIPDGSDSNVRNPCPECFHFSAKPPHNFFVQGFEDLLDYNYDVTALLPSGPPLITTRSKASELAEVLSGVAPVLVGYKQWNQSPLPKEKWFSQEPLLGAIYVNRICSFALDENGTELSRCKCGRMKVPWRKARHRISEYRLSPSSWPGSDLFLLEGGTQNRGVFITQNGVQKLAELGFTNISLVETGWA